MKRDNKMAWYLLGKQYLKQGEMEKAHFCFLQAGEVYEAFEKGAADKWESIWLKSLRRTVMALFTLFILLYIPGDSPRHVEPHHSDFSPEPKVPRISLINGASQRDKDLVFYYVKDPLSPATWKEALIRMLNGNHEKSYLLYPGHTSDGTWIEWLSPTRILLGATHFAEGRVEVNVYEPALCQCSPSPAPDISTRIGVWKKEREYEAVLFSAMKAFYRLHGRLPAHPGELSRPYPANVLPGYTPEMARMFGPLKEKLGDFPFGSPDANERRDGENGMLNGQWPDPYLDPLLEPLRIIVDKTAHRLAVVSGNVILRNYPVGLGGERTPEGRFIISEKVRNPNGKSNGEFGSRGMTLSDTLYAIHGTNQPSSIGKDVSLGCVRMLNEDIEELFDMIPLGTHVEIVEGVLPFNILRGKPPFALPVLTEEMNPRKVYRWLG